MANYKFEFDGPSKAARELLLRTLDDGRVIGEEFKKNYLLEKAEIVRICYPSMGLKKDLFYSNGKVSFSEDDGGGTSPRTTISMKINFNYWFWIILLILVTAGFFLIPTLVKYNERKRFIMDIRYQMTGEGPKSGKKSQEENQRTSITINQSQKLCPFCGNTIKLADSNDGKPVVCDECGIEIN